MKKISIIFLIFSLILLTAIIKNSTKKIDEDIFLTEENIRYLKKDFGNIKLEHEYLSSAEKLLEFQDLYFDDQLSKKNIQSIKFIKKNSDKFELLQFKLGDE